MDDTNADLADLLQRVHAGDPAAQRQLVQDLFPLVAKVVRAYGSRGPDADDWIQEVFLRVFSALEQYRGKVTGGDWRELTAPWTGADVMVRVRKR